MLELFEDLNKFIDKKDIKIPCLHFLDGLHAPSLCKLHGPVTKQRTYPTAIIYVLLSLLQGSSLWHLRIRLAGNSLITVWDKYQIFGRMNI